MNQTGRLRVLMVGYNGANNTGAEALLQSDIADVRSVLGESACITVPTLNENNLRRYLSESQNLRIVPIPTLYLAPLRRLVRESDIVMLVEGSTYMDTWGSPLLWAFLWATHCAAQLGKEILAYSVDAGNLSPANARRVRSVASRTGLIVARSRSAARRLEVLGVSAPLEWTADNAFTFSPRPDDSDWVEREWPASHRGIVGIAPVDYALWPVVPRLWGPKGARYKWPYYFSRSAERRRSSEALAAGYARLADRIASRTGCAVALICMEQLDEPLAKAILSQMGRPGAARIFSARNHDASRMTVLLRKLSLLVTSRFHASVLSLAAAVPQVAVGHDLRLRTLYADLELEKEWFLDPRSADGIAIDPAFFARLSPRLERLLAHPREQSEALKRGHADHLSRARRNRELLAEFLGRHHAPPAGGAINDSRVVAAAVAGGSR